MTLFWQGLFFGLAIAAPVGAIGILCIQRTLTAGRWAGFVTGLGAATADSLYGLVAALGLTVISDFLQAGLGFIQLGGGLFLIFLGVRAWRAPVAMTGPGAAAAGPGSPIRHFGTTFLLTLTNPATILSFAIIFANFNLVAPAGPRWAGALPLVAGVWAGSALWWFILSGGVSLLRRRLTGARLRWINRAAGAALAGFGLFFCARWLTAALNG